MSRTFAVVPAAGQSRRMGQPKLLLPLGGRTVIEAAVAALQAAGVADVVVVTPPGADRLAELAQAGGAHVVKLEMNTEHMRETVEHGLAWLERHRQPTAADGWLLMPADHPTVNAEPIRAVLAARSLGKSIIVPTHAGARGHPVWLSWSHVAALRGYPPDKGINSYMRTKAEVTLELPVNTAAVTWDLDTPEDYRRLGGEG